ncbi:MAG TPA: class I SAM-dependent methyltransferase [Phenylobacterium sp.]|jgi:SAM-dependent methyltransferase
MLTRIAKALKPWPKHPIDKLYGIETSARVRRWRTRSGDQEADAANNGYSCSQPSIVRSAIGSLPPLEDAAFIDLGSGKGRVTAVATEFPFARIIGVELSAALCRMMRRNGERLRRGYPERTPMEVVEGDASRPELPPTGDVVMFLSNSFRGPLVRRLIDHLVAAWGGPGPRRFFFIYYNPVHFALFDEEPAFVRYAAERQNHRPEEFAAHPFENHWDSFVIWQMRSDRMAPALPTAQRTVVVEWAELGAVVQVPEETVGKVA